MTCYCLNQFQHIWDEEKEENMKIFVIFEFWDEKHAVDTDYLILI